MYVNDKELVELVKKVLPEIQKVNDMVWDCQYRVSDLYNDESRPVPMPIVEHAEDELAGVLTDLDSIYEHLQEFVKE